MVRVASDIILMSKPRTMMIDDDVLAIILLVLRTLSSLWERRRMASVIPAAAAAVARHFLFYQKMMIAQNDKNFPSSCGSELIYLSTTGPQLNRRFSKEPRREEKKMKDWSPEWWSKTETAADKGGREIGMMMPPLLLPSVVLWRINRWDSFSVSPSFHILCWSWEDTADKSSFQSCGTNLASLLLIHPMDDRGLLSSFFFSFSFSFSSSGSSSWLRPLMTERSAECSIFGARKKNWRNSSYSCLD